MVKDKRTAARRSLRYTAWVALDGDERHGCVISDISDTGARLDLENPAALPDTFVLLLSSRGAPKRKCKVVWRTEHQIGVQFDRRLPQAAPVRRQPQPSEPLENYETVELPLPSPREAETEPAAGA
jgi:hypothetical protein